MSEAQFKLVDGVVVELGPDEIAEREQDSFTDMAQLKAAKTAELVTLANVKVLDAMPDIARCEAIRQRQAQLTAQIASKQKPHTLAAIDITAGWPA